MRALLFASMTGLVLVTASGCLKGRAQTPVPLQMPEPPRHVVVPAPVPVDPVPPTAPPVAAPTSSAPPPTPPTPPPTPPKPTGTTTTPPPANTPPPDPAPVLQTTTNTTEQVRKIQEQIENAQRDLGKVDRQKLPRDVRDQFDQASTLCRLAEHYLKVKAFDLADRCAEKAARMANVIAKGFISPTSL
jgi:hypothetical protein